NRKEVLYIDAADQAKATRASPLLPGALRRLPKGVLCVITSRPDREWQRLEESVTVWDMGDHTDDRADVGAYLERRAGTLDPPLSHVLIQQIVTQTDAPVFFTVESCLRQLEDPDEKGEEKERLRQMPAPWVVPAGVRVAEEADRRVVQAEAAGISEE